MLPSIPLRAVSLFNRAAVGVHSLWFTFGLFFFTFVGDQTQTSAWPSFGRDLNHENCNVLMLLKH